MNKDWTIEKIVELVDYCYLDGLDEAGLIYHFEVIAREEGLGVLVIPLSSESRILHIHGDCSNHKGRTSFRSHGHCEELKLEDYIHQLNADFSRIQKEMERYQKYQSWLSVFSK